jgi:hypothetical protein
MSISELFDDPVADKPQPPDIPSFWVRRLVLVAGLSADAQVIREIPFRRGLNVVRVADPPPDYSGPVGHSVGKTLLTRLLRYCLGEKYYAPEEVTTRIVGAYPTGYVIAQIVIGQANWIVARPLAVAGNLSSFSLQSNDWRALQDGQQDRGPFDAFVTAFSEAVVGDWPSLQLPDAKRSARWTDVLGWLARDQECNFTHHNVWRSKDAHSDSREHSRNDCSLIAAWALGLIDQAENELRKTHQSLLDQKEVADRQKREGEAAQSASKRILNERFPSLSQEQDDDLFTKTAATEAGEKVRQLKELQAELDAPANLSQMKTTVADLRRKQLEANGRVERLKAQIQGKESQIETEQAATTAAAYSPGCLCPSRPSTCPRNGSGDADPATRRQAETVQRIEAELVPLRADRDRAVADLEGVSERLRAAETAFDAEGGKHRDNLRKLAESIGRWEAHSEEVRSYSDAKSRGIQASERLERLERDIGRSNEALRKAREVQDQRVSQLSLAYAEVLRELLGQDVPGQIELDGWGVRPKPGIELKTNGQAMATLATVIGFDLACLRSATLGLTKLPRFFIHDSPKASDLESALYDRVYLPLFRLDSPGGDREPAFQYIITTTTIPPGAAAGDPYVCLTLDARSPEGHLLKAKF